MEQGNKDGEKVLRKREKERTRVKEIERKQNRVRERERKGKKIE